jgi:ribosomal-protein-alanine N-acetyltransferase
MIEYQLLNTTDFATTLEKEAIANFLLQNLDDYLDTRDNVNRAIEYALSKFPHQGGFILMAREEEAIVGVAVVNRTNFEGYFAENILVYLAMAETARRRGIATELLKRSKVYSKGSVMIRLRSNDTRKELFTKAGFEQDSLEFILSR